MSGWSGRRVAALFLLATLCAQAAWILALPPLRGIDEFDHAFRATGVASGQWRLEQPAAAGRGLLVEVPEELVDASRGQCEDLPYIEPETCRGDGPGAADGTVLATTSAANYIPAYYWVVGTAGEPFSGAASVYAMRIASALLCALAVAAAVWCLSTWVRGPWAYVGLLVGLTPTLVYTTSVIAPNGLEMGAGVLLWAALLGIGRDAPSDAPALRTERWLLGAATVAVVLLAGLRTLGPLWVLLIVGSVVLLRGPRWVLAVGRRHAFQVTTACLLGLTTCAAVLWWNAGNVPVPGGALNSGIDSSWGQVVRWPRWFLGSVGTFPFRDQPAPLAVHVLVALVLVTLIIVAVRRGAGRGRWAVVIATVACLLVPSALVAVTLEERGGVWQGRYLLPFAAGVALLIGLVVDRAGWRSEIDDRRPQLLAVGMLGLAHVISVVHVQLAELDRPVSAGDPGWVHPPSWGTAALMVAAWLVLGLLTSVLRGGPTPQRSGGVPASQWQTTP